MTEARTRVGIVEWARRARGSHTVEMHVADSLGTLVASSTDLPERLLLAGRARRHAWRSEQWASIVPLLHDVTLDEDRLVDADLDAAHDQFAASQSARDGLRGCAAVTRRLAEIWEGWLDETDVVADAPYARVLEHVVHDARAELAL